MLGGRLQAPTREGGNIRELLSLPLPPLEARSPSSLSRMFPEGRPVDRAATTYATQARLGLMVRCLNLMWGNGRLSEPQWSEASEGQRAALERLYREAADFIVEDEDRLPEDWLAELGKKAHAYWGEEVAVTVPLSFEQAEPALPRPGLAGKVPVDRALRGGYARRSSIQRRCFCLSRSGPKECRPLRLN